jgi:uncharacterized membrane protein YgdD (TMEM256/DUF423 family)
MDRTFLFLAGFLGFLGVAAGAFGAHALRDALDPPLLAAFNTGARYHLLHAVALLGVALLADRKPSTAVSVAGWSFVLGIALFSGSLYALALTGARPLGAITPFGGMTLLIGWAALAVSALQAP